VLRQGGVSLDEVRGRLAPPDKNFGNEEVRVNNYVGKHSMLSETEIRVILRAADDIIASGGRTLLAKILKGSREKIICHRDGSCATQGRTI
jgi:hypothetical protein